MSTRHPSTRTTRAGTPPAVSHRLSQTLVQVLGAHAGGEPPQPTAAAMVADSIAADLVAAPPPIGDDSDVVASLLESFLDHERRFLLPPPTQDRSPLPHEDEQSFRERARLIDELRAGAVAENTRRSYYGAAVAWRDWCEEVGIAPLPLDPARVADHLFDYAFELDASTSSYKRDDNGTLTARVVASTVGQRLTGLNKLAEYVSVARPGDNRGIQQMMSGLRRQLGTAPLLRKDALTHDLLLACLQVLNQGSFTAVRDRAAVLLRARAGVSLGQLAALEWADVLLADDQVVLTLAPAHKHGRPSTVVVQRHRNPRLCPVQALRDLEMLSPGGARHVFVRPARSAKDGRRIPPAPLSRQALSVIANRVAGDVGGWDGLPAATPQRLAVALESRMPTSPLPVLRDSALLLLGFWTAQRRRDLAALNWSDITDRGPRGLEVRFRRTKTDQEGRGHHVGVAVSPNTDLLPCPVAALRRWQEAVTEALGRAPRGDEPVFVALTAAGTVSYRRTHPERPSRLTGQGINDVVQRVVVAAGLAARTQEQRVPFGAHSLRAGFITSARHFGLNTEQIMKITGHADPRTLADYWRDRDVLFNSPGAQMMAALASRPAAG